MLGQALLIGLLVISSVSLAGALLVLCCKYFKSDVLLPFEIMPLLYCTISTSILLSQCS